MVALAALDPQRLLWRPRKTIFIPARHASFQKYDLFEKWTGWKETESDLIGEALEAFYRNGPLERKSRLMYLGSVHVPPRGFDAVWSGKP